MYVARQHEIDRETSLEFARSVAIGQWVSHGEAGLNATILPFSLEERGGRLFAQAHFNRVNRQWADDGEAMVIVTGPVAHVSALDFPPQPAGARMPTVPTLNYVTVHLKGRFVVRDDDAFKLAHMRRIVEHFEPQWRMEQVDEALLRHALRANVGVELEVCEVVGKAKLSQNLSPEALRTTIDNLRARDPQASGVADLMEDIALPWAVARDGRIENVRVTGAATPPASGSSTFIE
ncbi:FMN-binding negative transcriptional regulator [Arcanobacterium wilhelmae]|uniref:FMN-binding negative transcriptional regulator n=1 Tax=Arcanobacterium wilhelmae TaxID=1803177 RepID=UPI00241567B8|nr:FMN-binding negative transcriptional regulator [Arcanobacterium wilhelmae]WFN90462.1 FMN-binding negative transcriptional regulator [Arcanobacterium wilhelmae]